MNNLTNKWLDESYICSDANDPKFFIYKLKAYIFVIYLNL